MPDLIVMRLADMRRVHPDQITGRCSSCGHEVGIYPSGQQVMREHADVRLVCQVCRQPGANTALAPGAEFEPMQSVDRIKAQRIRAQIDIWDEQRKAKLREYIAAGMDPDAADERATNEIRQQIRRSDLSHLM
ncbi:hypothetical protein ABIF78_007758 [Bradyrhizobium japonicum]|jgi:hypothetical protein